MPYRGSYSRGADRRYVGSNRLARAVYTYPVYTVDPYIYDPYLYNPFIYGGYPTYPWVPTVYTNVIPSYDGVPLRDLI
jgi:hypothetical protein